MDCTDIKALLSGLIDDAVDLEERHDAERHLARCARCRELVDEAEALDELVEAHASSMIDPSGLPGGFEDAVLRRTVHARPARGYLHQWTTWTGWLAAAAALAMAVTIWIMDRRPEGTEGRKVVINEPAPEIFYANGRNLQSQVYEGTSLPEPEPGPSLSREDAETLYFASVLLQMVADADPRSFQDIERVRTAIEYEELLPQLAGARRGLAPEDIPSVLAAESLLVRIARGPLSQEDVELLRDTVSELHLAEEIDSISDRRIERHEV